ncbi:hypothetical protein FE257_005218 [Aspergillus nanangensis]|uniref:Secreted protein n=1 Tax=Aspergillus nanangensis TaxID=2582783 RepID=A0AAD4CQY4_ASPNN|nr:hypothetical protein FE257_005218 [Aspergillus nanangensis]
MQLHPKLALGSLLIVTYSTMAQEEECFHVLSTFRITVTVLRGLTGTSIGRGVTIFTRWTVGVGHSPNAYPEAILLL